MRILAVRGQVSTAVLPGNVMFLSITRLGDQKQSRWLVRWHGMLCSTVPLWPSTAEVEVSRRLITSHIIIIITVTFSHPRFVSYHVHCPYE